MTPTLLPLHADVKAPLEVFQEIFRVFLALGTVVGVVVIAYMVYNAYKYRDDGDRDDDVDRPTLGELPTGGGKGGKLFISFGMSAIIVVSLVAWTYTTLLYVEDGPPEADDDVNVEVVGRQFDWQFVYPNGHTSGTLRVPKDRAVRLTVTSEDVFHNFGIPEFKVKADAIPGRTTDTWFVPKRTGTFQAKCYELCGSGHSHMTAEVVVMEQEAYDEWYASTSGSDGGGNATTTANGSAAVTAPATAGGGVRG